MRDRVNVFNIKKFKSIRETSSNWKKREKKTKAINSNFTNKSHNT